jgi:hypothetical protein
MRYGRAFAILAAFFAIIAALEHLTPSFRYPGIILGDKYWVRGPAPVLLFGVAASVNFAVLYYGGDRLLHVVWNRVLSIFQLSSFALFGICSLIAFSVSSRLMTGSASGEGIAWLIVLPWMVGLLSLLLSLLAFGLNLLLAASQLLRTRFAKP